jgi:hypothetical protein
MTAVRVEMVQGMKLHHSHTRGVLSPVVVIPRMAEILPGGNAIFIHEFTHARELHALKGLFIAVLSLGVLYPWWRRRCEIRADAFALKSFGKSEFLAMCEALPEPTTKAGKYRYGNDRFDRVERAWIYMEENL